MNPANLIKMDTHNYDELKKKFEALLEENNGLKAKIRKLEAEAKAVIPLHESVRPGETLFQEPKEPESSRKSIATDLNDTSCTNKPVACRISMHSQNHEKIALFMSLFKGRTDVYAKKWKNKKGLTGYSPVCLNEWTPGICNKPKIKCSRCGNQSYGILNESVIEKHLRGLAVIGVYPMHPDETCHFLAIDFDFSSDPFNGQAA